MYSVIFRGTKSVLNFYTEPDSSLLELDIYDLLTLVVSRRFSNHYYVGEERNNEMFFFFFLFYDFMFVFSYKIPHQVIK